MNLEAIGIFTRTEAADIYICTGREGGKKERMALWAVKDRRIIRMLVGMRILPCLGSFPYGEQMCFLFPYREGYPVRRVFNREWPPAKKKAYFLEMVSLCLTEGLPWEILALVLKQDAVCEDANGELYLSYCLELDGLDEGEDERSCAKLCGALILELLSGRDDKENQLRYLLEKKQKNEAYYTLGELYRDLSLVDPETKIERYLSKKPQIEEADLEKWRDRTVKAAAVLLGLALVCIFMQIIFGDIPVFRFLGEGLERIGSESLLK